MFLKLLYMQKLYCFLYKEKSPIHNIKRGLFIIDLRTKCIFYNKTMIF